LFKERKTKFVLLSLLSALVVVSTAFVGISIYAQADDSELTTFEEQAIDSGVKEEATGLEDDKITTSAAADDNAAEDGETATADLSFLEGLQVCNVGTAEVSNETEVAAVPDEDTTPTVSVEVMTETEVAELAANETETASVGNETSTASATCISARIGGDNATSTAGNATDLANATSTASDAMPASNLTGVDNATSTLGAPNATSTPSTTGSEEKILVIGGQDFAPGQVVLIFSEGALVGIDDVDPDGNIEAKIPMPDGGTAIAGNDTASTELRFVESGTQRTATFEFDGETLTAAAGGDIEAAETTPVPAPAPSGNATSNDTSTANDTSSNYTAQ